MSKYNNGDKFLIEIDDNALMGNSVLYKIKGFNALVFDEYGLDRLQKYEEEKYRPSELDKFRQAAFEAGMNETWELAKKICYEMTHIPYGELKRIFGLQKTPKTNAEILTKISPQEAKERLELSMEEIKVNDVVRFVGTDEEGVVLEIYNEQDHEMVWLYMYNKEQNRLQKTFRSFLKKTGRTIEVQGVLSQLGDSEW